MAKDSALSRWAGQPVVKDVRFQLSLDDPKLPREDWVVIQGDRNQLAALCEAVSQYVQELLHRSPNDLNWTSAASNGAIATSTDRPISVATMTQPTAGILLRASGLLNHEVHWGALATPETGATTRLSTLQLFDLANALDDYADDVLELPQRSPGGWVKSFPNWAQVAAVILVAVGLSTSALRLLDGSTPTPMTASAPTSSEGASSSDQKIATQLPPAVIDKATPPVSSNEKLPPPPPVGVTPTGKLGLPTVTTPKSPTPSPASGTVPSNSVAVYPVPIVPGAPTIIRGEAPANPAPPTVAAVPLPPSGTVPVPNAAPIPPNAAIAARRGAIADESTANNTAFDTIPQVAEVRTYFQQKWNPPEGLSQILEYSIRLNANGSIENISPLRQASGDYIDRTAMPLIGEPFVSPLKGRQSAKIRVVLEPNGQVRAFLEE
jgi:hypothetical protein